MFAARAPKGTAHSTANWVASVQHKEAKPERTLVHNASTKRANIAAASPTPSSTSSFESTEPAWMTYHGSTESTSNHSTIGDDSIYSKNEHTIVALFGPLPREVEEALAKTDFYRQPMTAKVDLDAGYGIVVSQSRCYIWAVQKNVTYRTPPPCYTFPMPPNSLDSIETSVLLPSVTITNSDDNYSGLLACSLDGTCWYWDNIELSVSNADQHVSTKINLLQGDYVTHVESAGVYEVAVKKQYGAAYLTAKQLSTQGGGAMASIFNLIGMGQAPDTTQKITSLTSGPKLQDPYGRWDLYAMTRRSLYKWQLLRVGEPAFEVEIPLKDLVLEKINRDLAVAAPFGMDPKIRLLDVKYIRNSKLLVLASFFEEPVHTPTTPLTYGLFTLSSQYGQEYDVESAKYIRRVIEEDLRPEASPKLVIPQGGPRAFVITPASVIIKSSEAKDDFEEIIPLKNDRIVGFGGEDWRQRNEQIGDASELSIVCRRSGRLGIHVQVDGVTTSKADLSEEDYMTTQLLAKLEQAVYFGNKQHNPISFDLALYDRGDLNKAALKVNEEILNSHAGLLASGSDMTTRLAERFQRVKSIIESIGQCHMTNRLSVDTRFKLCWSAEKMAAANALWHQFQWKLASREKSKESKALFKKVLQDAAALAQHQPTTESNADDLVSLFLKYHVDKLGELLVNIQVAARKQKNLSQHMHEELVRDINSLLILSLRSAWSYRQKNVEKYALQGDTSVEPWTGIVNMIKSLTAQFNRTIAVCKAEQTGNSLSMDVDGNEAEVGLTRIDSELKEQLYGLADVTLQAHSERLQYLEGLPHSSETDVLIGQAVEEYKDAKSHLLSPLATFEDTTPAKKLAQKYRDFTTLVKLCKGDRAMLEDYIQKYQQPFADALFQWYIEQNQIPVLMEHGEQHSDLFTSFLDRSDYGDFAWLHDIKIKRFIAAAEKVHEGALLETNMDRRQVMFSLNKLLFLADLPAGNISVESSMKYLGRSNEELDFATIQTLVADEWGNMVGALDNVADKAEAIVDSFGSSILSEQPVLREAIVDSISSLLKRQTLSSEDLLDVLMVQQTREIENMDVVDVALGICMNAADIPENRRPYVLQDVWRRIFIADQDGYWKLSETNDFEAREKLMHSWMCRAYATIYRAEGAKDDRLLGPEQTKCNMPEDLFRQRFQRDDRSYKGMVQDYERENEELEKRLRQGDLMQKWRRVKEIVAENDRRIHENELSSSQFLPDASKSQDVDMDNESL
ncbi:hypothetical protein BGZ94_007025 [Podila epigama]|nr:hypothetical protein BGZ94_007025 [Podila epigama]